MPYFGFKLNPKQQVESCAQRMYGRDARIKVNGTRDLNSERYIVECVVNGAVVATAQHVNWRKAYKLLVAAVEDAHRTE